MRIILCLLVSLFAACQREPDSTLDASTDRIDEEHASGEPIASEDEIVYDVLANQAGCDGVGNSCSPQGQCCDTHDDCIDRNCPPGMGSVLTCTPLARLRGRCPAACFACHTAVVGCMFRCNPIPTPENPNPVPPADCQPSDCCGDPTTTDDDTCGEEQACYDRTGAEPELITDPCECEARGIDLSPSPPRPSDTCCVATGYGCCQGEGAKVPGPGGGGCCSGLVATNGTCRPPSGSGSGSGSGSARK